MHDPLSEAAEWFSGGLEAIGDQLQKPVTTKTQAAYFSALAEETDADEWAEFCRVAPKRFGWDFLPSAPKMLTALREFRGEPSAAIVDHALAVEAGEAYQRVMDAGTYTAEAGTVWSHRVVTEKCGRAAAEAFTAAGGPTAWATTWNESKRRDAFLAAYQVAAREAPSSRLLPAGEGEPKQITAGAQQDPQLTQVEAKGFLEMLRPHLPAGELPEMPKEDAFDVNCDPERYARIKAEAERLKLEGAAEAS